MENTIKVIDEIWAEYDKNNSNTLTYDEAKLLFRDLFKSMKKEVTPLHMNAILGIFDTDGSGEIQKSEFKSILISYFN